jgi:hypothetical protein
MQLYTKGKDGNFYTCSHTKSGWKCGSCGRGKVTPSKGSMCAVCGCRVSQVVADGEAAMPVSWVVPNAKLCGGA